MKIMNKNLREKWLKETKLRGKYWKQGKLLVDTKKTRKILEREEL